MVVARFSNAITKGKKVLIWLLSFYTNISKDAGIFSTENYCEQNLRSIFRNSKERVIQVILATMKGTHINIHCLCGNGKR